MTLVKKLINSWSPSEKPDLKVGETIEMTDVELLIRSGAAVIVDEAGVEQPFPGQKFACPICYRETETLAEFTDHVTNSHQKAKEEAPIATTATEKVAEGELTASEVVKVQLTKAEKIKEKRLAALAKARAVRANKLQEGRE